MRYTEKYELPLIEGTDVPNYAPFNEGMNKIEDELSDLDTSVEQAVTDVQQTKTEIETENAQFRQEMTEDFEETTTELTSLVNNSLSNYPRYELATQLNLPRNLQICGETGNNVFPLSQASFVLSNHVVVDGDHFKNTYSSAITNHYCKLSLDMVVGATSEGDDIEVSFVRYDGVGQSVVNKSTTFTLDIGENNIHMECILNLASADGIGYRYIHFDSTKQLTLMDKPNFTIEYLGQFNNID